MQVGKNFLVNFGLIQQNGQFLASPVTLLWRRIACLQHPFQPFAGGLAKLVLSLDGSQQDLQGGIAGHQSHSLAGGLKGLRILVQAQMGNGQQLKGSHLIAIDLHRHSSQFQRAGIIRPVLQLFGHAQQ